MNIILNENYGPNIPFGLRSILYGMDSVRNNFNFSKATVDIIYNIEEAKKEKNLGKLVIFVNTNEIYVYYNKQLIDNYLINNASNSEENRFLEAYSCSNVIFGNSLHNDRENQKKGKEFRNIELPRKMFATVDKSGYKINVNKYIDVLNRRRIENGTLYNTIINLVLKYNELLEYCFKLQKQYNNSLLIFKFNPNFNARRYTHIYEKINDYFRELMEVRNDTIMLSKLSEEQLLGRSLKIHDVIKKIKSITKESEYIFDEMKEIEIDMQAVDDEVIYENFHKNLFRQISEAVSSKLNLIDENDTFELYKGKINRKTFSELTGNYLSNIPRGITLYDYILVQKRDINEKDSYYCLFNLGSYNRYGTIRDNYYALDTDKKKNDYISILYNLFGEKIASYDWISVADIINYIDDKKVIFDILCNRTGDFLTASTTKKLKKDIIADYVNDENISKFLNSNSSYVLEKLFMLPNDKFEEYVVKPDILSSIVYRTSKLETDQMDKIQNAISKYTGYEELSTIAKMEEYGYKFSDKTILLSASRHSTARYRYERIMKLIKNHPNLAIPLKKIARKLIKSNSFDHQMDIISNDIKLDISKLYNILLFNSYRHNDNFVKKLMNQILNYKDKIPQDMKISISNRLKEIDKNLNTDYYQQFNKKN